MSASMDGEMKKVKKSKKHKSSSRPSRTHSEERLYHGAVLGDEFYEGRPLNEPPPSISVHTAGPLPGGKGAWGTISLSSRCDFEDDKINTDKLEQNPMLTVQGLGVAAVDGRKRAARGGESEDGFSVILDVLSPSTRKSLSESGVTMDTDGLNDVTRSMGGLGVSNNFRIKDRVFHLLAVFDGHRAHHAARYCAEALGSELAPRLEFALQQSNEEEAVRSAIGAAVVATDGKFCGKRFVSLVRDNGKKFYLTAVREVAMDFDINAWDTYEMEREWRVALDAASVAHGIRCGVRGADLKRLAQEEQSRWHCYKKELFPGAALVAVLVDTANAKMYCANTGDCMAALVYPPPSNNPPAVSEEHSDRATPPPAEVNPDKVFDELRGKFNVYFPDITGGDDPAADEATPSAYGRCVLLSRPHKPADLCELKRVCATRNGFVEVHGQRVTPENADLVAQQVELAHAMGRKALYRINRDVSLSRAIGDFDLREFGMIATPDITVFQMEEGQTTALIVMASDGVWDVMSPEQVVELLDKDPKSHQFHQHMSSEGGVSDAQALAQSLAQNIVNAAFGIKKNNDDVTSVVAGINLKAPSDHIIPISTSRSRDDVEPLPPLAGALSHST